MRLHGRLSGVSIQANSSRNDSSRNDSSASCEDVIAACLEIGIREFVVCAGARNLSLVMALSELEGIMVWPHFEERSAGFYALGRTMDSGRPCAVVTTSGTAVAELLPAVVEAHYQARPLVLISTDRPAHYRGSGAPQVIEQVGIFGSYVEGSVDLSGIFLENGSENTSEAHRSGGRERVFQGWSGRAPWHVNLCLEEESSVSFSARTELEIGEFTPQRQTFNVAALRRFLEQRIFSGLVVALGGLEPEEREEVWHFLKVLGAPVIADVTSGLREGLGSLLLADPERVMCENSVGKVLRLGDVPVGRFWRDIEDKASVEVLSLSRTGFHGLARASEMIRGELGRVLKGYGEPEPVGDVLGLLSHNSRRWSQIDELLEAYPDSEPAMVRLISIYASVGAELYLGNSLPIREWNAFAQRQHPQELVHANRGANGIDGQLSTWLGATVGLDDAWGVFGDLTALYDMSAPALLEHCEGARRVIVIINNGGGRIFERLPRVAALEEDQQRLIKNEHSWSFGDWAQMWGLDYQRVSSADEFDVEVPDHGLVLEVVPDERETLEFWKAYEGD